MMVLFKTVNCTSIQREYKEEGTRMCAYERERERERVGVGV